MSNQRETPVERLWERNREGWKETNRKPSIGTKKECMRNQAGKNGENGKAERKNEALEKPLRGKDRKKRTEETEAE